MDELMFIRSGEMMMRRLLAFGLSISILCSLAPSAGAAAKPVREQKAVDAVSQMGQYLRGLKDFQVTVNANRDEVLTNGQILQFSHVTRMLVQEPDHLQADISGVVSGNSKKVYYDGKTFTILTLPDNYYATVDAPPTLKALKTKLNQDFGIEMPMADLFEWGTDNSAPSRLLSAVYVGDEDVGGKVCSHYAYREKGFDWQLWIAKGDAMLPCKLAIVDMDDPAHPHYTATYAWQLSPGLPASDFEFTPPPGAHPIDIMRTDTRQAK
jgi:hypothetical protein